MAQTLHDVVIPAGGTIDDIFARRIGTPYRALAPLGPANTPVLQVVIDALRASGCAGRIVVVAQEAVKPAVTGFDLWLPSTPSGVEGMLLGLREVAQDRPALICAADMPLTTGAEITDFCRRSDPEAMLGGSFVTAASYQAAYPDAPDSTWVHLRDTGPGTLGGIFRLKPSLLSDNKDLIDRLFRARKSQWQMANVIGPKLIWQFLTRQLTLSGLVLRTERILGYHPDIVRDVAPSLAFDIDCVADYDYAHGRLGQAPKT